MWSKQNKYLIGTINTTERKRYVSAYRLVDKEQEAFDFRVKFDNDDILAVESKTVFQGLISPREENKEKEL